MGSTDGISRLLQAVGSILIFASIVAAIVGYVVSGNAFAYQVQQKPFAPRMEFNFWVALGVGIGSLFSVLAPGLALCGLGRLIDYTQQTSEHTRALASQLKACSCASAPGKAPESKKPEAVVAANPPPRAHLEETAPGNWACSACGEVQDSRRNICWNCGAVFAEKVALSGERTV